MKREKVQRLIRDVVEAREAMPSRPVTIDSLEIDFDTREVLFRGRLIKVEPGMVLSIPLLSTDRLVVGAVGTKVI